MAEARAQPSAFLEPGLYTTANSLAIAQLSRDHLVPIVLNESSSAIEGYAEGAVLNTRYGSFPHSTMIGVAWGSQVRASKVDTGSRGRKRKRTAAGGDQDDSMVSTPNVDDADSNTPAPVKKAVTASSGFIHILPPTPELWTRSLPHRTQVVYTPDYSYILQRIHARPGTRLIEAGAGSGSFTHASVRAVYSGYPTSDSDPRGKVYSYEFNEARYNQMKVEIEAHRLNGLVQLTHRDAYNGGFLVYDDDKTDESTKPHSPEAESIFLDLPAPWDALPHLARSKPKGAPFDEKFASVKEEDWVSPLNPKSHAYICTFSPCIEQVQRTVRTMRQLGWVDIDMIEIAHRALVVQRDGPAPAKQEKRAPPEPVNVEEAVIRLREIERKAREYNAWQHRSTSGGGDGDAGTPAAADEKAAVVDNIAMDVDNGNEEEGEEDKKPWEKGRIIHRSESELKTHTSYLVFATLPREWTAADEEAALAKWPCGRETFVVGDLDKATRKKEKREQLTSKKQKKKDKQDKRDKVHDVPVVDEAEKA